MMLDSATISIGIYRNDPDANVRLDELEPAVGQLLGQLVEQPRYFVGVPTENAIIKLQVERTRETEIIIVLVIIGSSLVLQGALTEIGKRLGGWLVDQLKKLGTRKNPEVRTKGHMTVVVNPSTLNESVAAITKLASEAAKAGTRLEIVVEPGVPGST
jgi:hypothetical protein